MTADARDKALGETLAWFEQQIGVLREALATQASLLEQTQRQVNVVAEDADAATRAVREIDPKIQPFAGLPEKVRSQSEDAEQLRSSLTGTRQEIENQLRIISAEVSQDRAERTESSRRLEAALAQSEVAAADTKRMASQLAQVNETMAALLERQREVEGRVDHAALRLERAIEVNADLESRIGEVLKADQEERFEIVYDRLQVVGEMVKRNEETIDGIAAQRDLREEVLEEIHIWRDQHARIDTRLNTLEELTEGFTHQIEKVAGEVTLLEGRHSGLGERVAGMRRDISEVVDGVREEFVKFNKFFENQRRKQIQALEQELREAKFHTFRPPEEP